MEKLPAIHLLDLNYMFSMFWWQLADLLWSEAHHLLQQRLFHLYRQLKENLQHNHRKSKELGKTKSHSLQGGLDYVTFQERVADTQIKVLRKTHKKQSFQKIWAMFTFQRKKTQKLWNELLSPNFGFTVQIDCQISKNIQNINRFSQLVKQQYKQTLCTREQPYLPQPTQFFNCVRAPLLTYIHAGKE